MIYYHIAILIAGCLAILAYGVVLTLDVCYVGVSSILAAVVALINIIWYRSGRTIVTYFSIALTTALMVQNFTTVVESFLIIPTTILLPQS